MSDEAVNEETEQSNEMEVYKTSSRGQTVLHTSRNNLLNTINQLYSDGYNVCIDVTAVDYLENPKRDLPVEIKPERFELVVNLLSHQKRERRRLRIQVPDNDPTVPTLFDIYPGTEALEREVHDLFGIYFDGHPDMTRILMPENWEGHPLRKDYDVGKIPVQFKEAPGS